MLLLQCRGSPNAIGAVMPSVTLKTLRFQLSEAVTERGGFALQGKPPANQETKGHGAGWLVTTSWLLKLSMCLPTVGHPWRWG